MRREIYEVTAKVVDANGTYNTVTGYPKSFDSRNYGDDPDKALRRAVGEFSDQWGAMCKRDDRKLQLVMITDIRTGETVAKNVYGTIPDDPGRVTPEE